MSMSSIQSQREYIGRAAQVGFVIHCVRESVYPGTVGTHSTRVWGPITGSGLRWVDLGRCQAAGVNGTTPQLYDGYFSECSLQESQLAQRAQRMVKKWSLLAAGGGDVCQAFVGVVREPCFCLLTQRTQRPCLVSLDHGFRGPWSSAGVG